MACGPGAFLSHESASALSGFHAERSSAIHISLTSGSRRRLPGIVCHRRSNLHPSEITHRHGIPLTSPAATLVDLAATKLPASTLERAVNEADRLDLTNPENLRAALDEMPRRPGVARLRDFLDRRTFVLTDSELERLFVPIARRAGLPKPQTRVDLNGFRVDFFWPGLGLVVETDGLRYHRTPAEQARDRLRDQAHTAAGLTPLRFTHGQVRYEPDHVEATLQAVGARLTGLGSGRGRQRS